ncbi:MAG: cobyrinate a,c-diamide synthase [Bacteroidaceae bacterium]|nr:cobyrinate a,c-diamide synthase [Bacteroidaceae bacterium]
MNRGFLIGAASSGSGKTTLAMGLMRALRNRGLSVQPYKCGPDYIDTMFHHQATGRDSVNLDTYLASPAHVSMLFRRYGQDADVRVVEGVMGLYDGYDKALGSSAEIAAQLGLPVLLIVNAQSVAYSVAPLIHGFRTFPCAGLGNRPLNIGGVVFNKVGSERHYHYLREACEDAGARCFGYLSRDERLTIPGRHLGLTVAAQAEMEKVISLAAEEVEQTVDVAGILSLGSTQTLPEPTAETHRGTLRIAVASDEAFNFVYRANLDALAQMGKLHRFSPLHDTQLPPCDLLYLPGGYPELYAGELSANEPMRTAIGRYAESGGRVFAECGGFMYLCRDIDGQPMCGVFPFSASMAGARLHLGYRKIHGATTTICGHEFHYSHCDGMPDGKAVYRYKNVMAGYTHWYWAETGFEELWKAI